MKLLAALSAFALTLLCGCREKPPDLTDLGGKTDTVYVEGVMLTNTHLIDAYLDWQVAVGMAKFDTTSRTSLAATIQSVWMSASAASEFARWMNEHTSYTNKAPSYMIPDGQTNAGRWVWLPIRDADIIAWGSRQQGFSLNHVQWTNGEGGTLIWTPYQTREIEEP